MKINNNRECDTMKSEGYFNTQVGMGDASYPAMDYGNYYGMDCCQNQMMGETLPGIVCPPVYECPRETVCHRYICHEVPHIMPCNTRIINHHIYRHTYTPTYSCCEENDVQNVYERRCC